MKREMSYIGTRSLLGALCLFIANAATAQPGRDDRPPAGRAKLSFLAQVTDMSPDRSIEVGYWTSVNGLQDLFSGDSQNESTALLTFYAELKTTAVFENGPLTIIERLGIRTIYVNSSPHANFSDPESFRQGEPVLVMSVQQHIVIDRAKDSLTTSGGEEVLSTTPFEKDGVMRQLFADGLELETYERGTVNGAGPPDLYIAGRSAGIPLPPEPRTPPPLGGPFGRH